LVYHYLPCWCYSEGSWEGGGRRIGGLGTGTVGGTSISKITYTVAEVLPLDPTYIQTQPCEVSTSFRCHLCTQKHAKIRLCWSNYFLSIFDRSSASMDVTASLEGTRAAPFQHEPLDPNASSIRFVQVLPTLSRNGSVQCRIVHRHTTPGTLFGKTKAFALPFLHRNP
jgi:hypothetical protein